MKIGIISDIHGNKKALDAVLKQLEKENIETKNQIKSMQQDIAELKKSRA